MAIARTSSGSGAGGVSHSFGNNSGDLIVLCLLNTLSGATLPSTPTGYTSLVSGQDSTDGFTMKIVYKFSTGANESATPSNTTSLAWACYSGVDNTTPFSGTAGQAGSATTTISYSGIVSFVNPGSDWVLCFGVSPSASGAIGSHPPTSESLPTGAEYTTGEDCALFDSNGALSTYSFNSKTLSASEAYITKTTELHAAAGGGGGGTPTNLFFFA